MAGIGAIIGGALASAGSNLISSVASPIIQGEYNKIEAQKQRDFQERMSNTAIQRQIADMEKAGLSPAMLFGNSVNSATTPRGTSASISAPHIGIGNILNTVGELIKHERELDTKEDIARAMIENKKTNESDFKTRNYLKKDLNYLYDNLEDINL